MLGSALPKLDVEVDAFRNRSLAHVEFPYVYLDATYVTARDTRTVTAGRRQHTRQAWPTLWARLDHVLAMLEPAD